jgi:glycerophosphoryl diester phosphodiesterase
MPALIRVGHKGADLIAPGNTARSFDAALAAGVDMVEFDVLPERWLDGSSGLRLAHDYGDLGRRADALTLEEGLDHLAPSGTRLDVDLKGPGYELRVVEALRARGLVERSMISSQYRESLALIRAHEPALRLGWSVPKTKSDPFESAWRKYLVYPALAAYRAQLPVRAAAGLRAGRFDAVMAHWRLVTGGLVRAVRRAGGELYVWTVDDRAHIERLEQLGVTGVITNDPRLFAPAPPGTVGSP